MKFINVKECLPDHPNYVLVTDQKNVWIGEYSSRRWSVVYNGSPPVESNDITGWMELPHPIKGYQNFNSHNS